jgi:hypothetical protein
VSSSPDPAPARRVPLALVPFVVYVGVTLLEPALNGAGRNEAFWEHAAITLGVSGLLSWPWFVMGRRSNDPGQPGWTGQRISRGS